MVIIEIYQMCIEPINQKIDISYKYDGNKEVSQPESLVDGYSGV